MVAKRVLLYTAAVLTTAGLAAFVFLEPVINAPPVKSWVVNRIERQTGTRIDPAFLTFRLTPQPGIQVKQLELPLTRDIGLSIDTVHLDLDMQALLKKKIGISRIFLKDLNLRTATGEGGTGLTFHEPLDFQFPKEQTARMFALLPDTGNQMQVVFENSETRQFSSLTGSLWISKTEQILQFDTRIQDLNVKRDWLARFFSAPDFRLDQLTSKIARLHVRLNPETGITGRLSLDRFEIISSRLTTAPVSGNETRMHFSYQPDQVSFHLDPTALKYPLAQVSMSFSNNLAQKETALTFQGRQVDIAQAREASLALGPDSQVVRELFGILQNGMASEVSVGFHADSWNSLFDPRHLILEGTAEKARVNIPATPLIAEDVNGTARVSDGILTIVTGTGTVDRSDMRKGSLSIDLLHPSHVPFTGDFDLNVDLAEVPAVLARLLPDTKLAQEMARVSGVSGRTSARLTLAVEKDQPDLLVTITTPPFSATGAYDRIPFPLSVSRAGFSYENGRIRIAGLSGSIGNNRVTNATAQITVGKTPYLDLSVENLEIDVQDTWPKLYSWKPFQTRMEPVKQMAGHLMIGRLAYQGPLFDLVQGRFDFAGTARDIRIGFSSDSHEILGLSGAFQASENRAGITDLTARITDLDWLSRWIPPAYTAGIALPLQMEAGGLHLDHGRMSVSGQAALAPNVRLSVRMTGNGPDDLKPEIIELEHKPLTDAVIRFVREPETTRVRFHGRLDTRTLESVLDRHSPFHQSLTALTGGQPVEIISDHGDNLRMHFRLLQLDDLAKRMNQALPQNMPFVLPWKNLTIHADRLIYGPLVFSGINAGILWDGNGPDMVLETADLCGVRIAGRMEMDLSTPDRQAATEITATASDKENLASLVSCFFPDMRLMDGNYSLNAALSGTGPVRRIPRDLTGEIAFESKNGRIHKMTLLSRLLSVLNILKIPDIRQEGFRYHRIQVKGHMKNGGIHLETAVIDAENMALFFTGDVHPFENRLDLTCLVAPFKTIDTIVQFIPVVNTILEGRLVSFPAKATGPINDPVITPMHPSAVGEGLINMFTSLLKSPARLLERVP